MGFFHSIFLSVFDALYRLFYSLCPSALPRDFFHAILDKSEVFAMTVSDFKAQYQYHRPTLQDAKHNYAVLVPLVETEDGLCLLYEVRSATIAQPGEVCFPGGRMETGETAVEAALRETREELGISADDITVLGELDFLYLRSDRLMYPVLGSVKADAVSGMHASDCEVADTFLLPLKWLQEHPPTVYRYPLRPIVGEDFPYDTVQVPANYQWVDGRMEVPIYAGLSHTLWGLSARITKHLIENMK